MLTITLVRVGGYLIGRTVSDRWNMETIGCGPIKADRNQSVIKRLRREYTGIFAFVVVRNAQPDSYPTQAEHDALGPANALALRLRSADKPEVADLCDFVRDAL